MPRWRGAGRARSPPMPRAPTQPPLGHHTGRFNLKTYVRTTKSNRTGKTLAYTPALLTKRERALCTAHRSPLSATGSSHGFTFAKHRETLAKHPRGGVGGRGCAGAFGAGPLAAVRTAVVA